MNRLVTLSTPLVASLLLVSGAASATTPSSADHPYRLEYALVPESVQMDSQPLALAAAHVEAVVDAGIIDGAVLLVARHGKVVLHQSFGKRDGNWQGDPAQNPPMPLDGIFDLQSVTKLFTAFIAEDLIEQGQLDPSAPVANYLPEYATPEKSGVLVRDLVRFTSGLSIDADAYLVGDPDPWATMLAQSLAAPPGTAVIYSDLGYRILGRVLEIAGGAPLDELVRERITGPLGMRDTVWAPLENLPLEEDRFVGTGYSTERTADHSPRYLRGETADDQDAWLESYADTVTGCDGAFSTAWDMALFGQMFLNRGARFVGKAPASFCLPGMPKCKIMPLVSPAGALDMMSLQTKDAAGMPLGISGATGSWLEDLLFANKGYGWELGENDPAAHVVTGQYASSMAVSKIGGAGTFITVDPDPSRDLVVVLLTNHGLPSFTGPDGIVVDANGNVSWNGYENMLNGISPNVVNDLVQLSLFGD